MGFVAGVSEALPKFEKLYESFHKFLLTVPDEKLTDGTSTDLLAVKRSPPLSESETERPDHMPPPPWVLEKAASKDLLQRIQSMAQMAADEEKDLMAEKELFAKSIQKAVKPLADENGGVSMAYKMGLSQVDGR